MEKRKNKALTILEFDKILNILAEYTSNEAVKKQIFELTPSKNASEAKLLQTETTQAQTQLLKYGSPPNLAVPAVINSIRRCEVGGVLSPRELLSQGRQKAIFRARMRKRKVALPQPPPRLLPRKCLKSRLKCA